MILYNIMTNNSTPSSPSSSKYHSLRSSTPTTSSPLINLSSIYPPTPSIPSHEMPLAMRRTRRIIKSKTPPHSPPIPSYEMPLALRRTQRIIKSKTPPKPSLKKKRCPNGSRRNNKTGNCDKKSKTIVERIAEVIPIPEIKRCPNGSRKNSKTRKCVSKYIQ